MGKLRSFALSRWGWPLLQAERGAMTAMIEVPAAIARKQRKGHPVPSPRADRDLTIVVKTFERPQVAERFVRHARDVFGGRIVIVDDSRTPMTAPDPNTDIVTLPHNSGVSVGRIKGLEAVQTPFVLMADDDHVLTPKVQLDAALAYLDRNPQVDAVALFVVEVPRMYRIDFGPESNALFPGHAPLKVPYGTVIDGLKVEAKTAQCYVARTESLRSVGWDPNIRMLDHSDFFSRAAGKIVFVQDEGMTVLHGRTPWRKAFNAGRDNTTADRAYLGSRWMAGER